MTLGSVRTRVLVGAGAWLLGAAAATGGSLLAVSRLGEGLADAPSQQLTVSMVNRALASESAEPSASSAAPAPSVRLGSTATPIRRQSARPTPQPTASPGPQPSSSSGTVLTSPGGTVVAGCASAGAYLLSWSPQQGYGASSVVRGPAATAKVTFKSTQRAVTMLVACTDGVPAAATQVDSSWGGDD